MFSLINFIDLEGKGTDEMSLVSTSWIDKRNKCYWPNYETQSRFNKAVQNHEPYDPTWATYPVRILFQSDSWKLCNINLNKARVTSDLCTDPSDVELEETRLKHKKLSSDFEYFSDCVSTKGRKAYVRDDSDFRSPKKKKSNKKTLPSLKGKPIPPEPPLTSFKVRFLGHVGGVDTAETTRNVMRKLMKTSVAIHFNWKGKGAKFPFSKLNLRSVVADAVRKSPVPCRSTDKDIEDVIKNWLRFAQDRDGGRKKRYLAESQLNQ